MAETGSPQFIMARSVASYAAGAICFSTAVILARAIFMTFFFHASPNRMDEPASSYRLSTLLIYVIQCFGVGIGTVAPEMRWFTAIRLRCSEKRVKNYKTEFKTENFWIERLVGWKDSPLATGVRGQKSRKLDHNTKNLILDFCIGVQIVIVATSKLIMLISIYLISQFLSFGHLYKELKQKLVSKSTASSNHTESESGLGTELELCRCVLYLEGEEELPLQILKNKKDATDHFIQKGEKQRPKYLKELLDKSTTYFHGLAKFDSDQVPSLDSEEPPNGWSLPVVTLTYIAIALPNIENHKVEWLLRSVSEGLLYVNLVEKLLNAKSDMVNIRNAADILWLRLDLFRKWLDEDLQKIALEVKTTKETLERLADIAKIIVSKFKANMNGNQKENPPSWDIKTIAANSMYRISQTVLLDLEAWKNQTDGLFSQLSVMIADILGACLTNLPRVITTKSFCSAIEKRTKSVQHAAQLLGETEEILKILQQHELPHLNPDKMAYIDEWRTLIKLENPLDLITSSFSEGTSSDSGELQIAVE